ncbi:MAG: DUF362 domain-containing protein [Paludibacteraceae bacterium]|nr:DUF362 domain-containing protein [Paludibacteraceae bacterium]MBN2787608.1 DUF362 domain-containing protein [Paludibacteraceae bacterium]
MKIFFNKTSRLKWTAISLGVIALIAWDMAFHSTTSIVNGSFRADNLFTEQGTAPATSVAVIASDNVSLADPVSQTSTLTQIQIEDMVRTAINLVGGIGTYVQSGDSVLIKPNIVGANTYPAENTEPMVVLAIMKIIHDAYGDACTLIIGEGSARSISTFGGTLWGNTDYNLANLAANTYLTSNSIEWTYLDLNDEVADGANVVTVPTPWNLTEPFGGYCRIHKILRSPNVKFINVPVLKMHEPGITCCMKNQIGIGAGWWYGWNKISGGEGPKMIHHSRFNETGNYKTWQCEELTDLCSVIDHFDLNVVDATVCMQTKKTYSSAAQLIQYNTIVAGPDPVAVDHVCTRMIGSNPDDIAHLTMGDKIGLGTNDPDKITILGENIATKYTTRFDRSGGSPHSTYGQGNRTWLISSAFASTNMANDFFTPTTDAALSPYNGAAGWSIPYYFFDDRIDLNSYHEYSGDESVITYLYTSVYSPTALTNRELWINSEEDIKVWVNGTLIENYSGTRPNGNLVSDKPLVNLQAGENTIIVKVLQTTGCYDFALNICDPGEDGNRCDNIKFYIKNYNEPAALNPNPTLSDPANKTQTVQLGNAITPINFVWGGAATDVTVTGLPAELLPTKTVGTKTLSISGTPSASGVINFTVTTVGGLGDPVVSTGSITCIACLSLAKISIIGLTPAGTYRLALFNAAGTTEIKSLANGNFTAGNSDFMFDRSGITSGTYTFKVLNGATVINSGTISLP